MMLAFELVKSAIYFYIFKTVVLNELLAEHEKTFFYCDLLNIANT